MYLEWRETRVDPETGAPVLDERGRPIKDRPRTRLRCGKADAKKRLAQFAEEMLRRLKAYAITLDELFTLSVKEVRPRKGAGATRDHDARAARVFRAWLAQQKEQDRRAHRLPSTLDRVDWDRFVEA